MHVKSLLKFIELWKVICRLCSTAWLFKVFCEYDD